MEERERMLDTIMEMQRCNVLKDEQIETLEQENQALKDRWQKLKEYAEKHFEEEVSSLAVAFRKVLVRMQELEKGEINGSK